jgi:hypothetical protein
MLYSINLKENTRFDNTFYRFYKDKERRQYIFLLENSILHPESKKNYIEKVIITNIDYLDGKNRISIFSGSKKLLETVILSPTFDTQEFIVD